MLFAQSQGAKFLKNKLMAIVLEESPTETSQGFAWVDGRRSVWRDIQNTVSYIHQLLEETSGNNA